MSNTKSTKEILSKISSDVYTGSTSYKFDKHKIYSDKYKKGNIAVYDWVSELCFYYLMKEKDLFQEFNIILKNKKNEFSKLEDGEFKKGLLDAIDNIEKIIVQNS